MLFSFQGSRAPLRAHPTGPDVRSAGLGRIAPPTASSSVSDDAFHRKPPDEPVAQGRGNLADPLGRRRAAGGVGSRLPEKCCKFALWRVAIPPAGRGATGRRRRESRFDRVWSVGEKRAVGIGEVGLRGRAVMCIDRREKARHRILGCSGDGSRGDRWRPPATTPQKAGHQSQNEETLPLWRPHQPGTTTRTKRRFPARTTLPCSADAGTSRSSRRSPPTVTPPWAISLRASPRLATPM